MTLFVSNPKSTSFLRQAAATHYDQYASIQEHIFTELLARTQSEETVSQLFDLGCGTGKNSVKWAEKFPLANITAFDFSAPMIDFAREHHSHPHVHYRCQDLHYWNPQVESVADLMVSNACLHWVEPFEPFLGKLTQSLSRSGTLSISLFGPKTYCELNHTLSDALYKNGGISANHFPDMSQVSEMFKAHFHEVSIQESLITTCYPSLLALFKTIKYTGTTGSGIEIPGLWTPRFMQKLEKTYRLLYGQIQATHQIFYLQASEPK